MRQDLIFGSTTPVATSDLANGSSEQRVLEALHGLREQAAVAEQIALARERVGRTDREADAGLALLELVVDGFVEEQERVLAVAGREQHLAERGTPAGGDPSLANPAGLGRLAPRLTPRRAPPRAPRRTCCRVRTAGCWPARRDQ